VSVTGVALDRSSLPLTVGGTGVLLAAVSPADAANKALTWSSDNTNVAAVDSSGNVTAVGAGTAVITAVTADGGYTAASTVTVTNAYIYFPPPAAVTPVE
ncbi:Ig-like domain-containing protein, partial [Paenibacillus sepulcri]|nr:Ig-like domain-containing protein [Paenibacillus sepulcri]